MPQKARHLSSATLAFESILTAIIQWIIARVMQTVVELPEFTKNSEKLLKDSERQSIVNCLASHPSSGEIMQGTGGIRKLRWSAQGKGKSGGVRVIGGFII